MKCPKCVSPMIKIRFEGIEVDRCTDCQGLWFDEFKKDELLKVKRSEQIDVGDAKVGRTFDRVNCIFCPRCEARMVRLTDLDQPHIHFEHCTVCGGAFLDAGEFRDLKRHNHVDCIKDLFFPLPTRRRAPPEKVKSLATDG